MTPDAPTVAAVSRDATHRFSKQPVGHIDLVAGIGVADDAHAGVTVQHLSRVRRDPTAPNLRQVHLIARELLDELAGRGYDVPSGALGENVTTRGVDLLGLPVGARLRLGADAVVEVTGLRNPCVQIDRFSPGLQRTVLDRGPAGELIRRAGIMAVVLTSGRVRAGDAVEASLPQLPHRPLEPV